MSQIQLHPTLGVNSHLCFCPRCGGDSPELVLLGNRTSIVKCPHCSVKIIGGLRMGESCPKCKHRNDGYGSREQVGTVGEHDKLPGSLCGNCVKELAEHKAIVAEGGIYWKCKACKQSGVIRHTNPGCQKVREHAKIPAPDPVGIEFDTCEEHGGPPEQSQQNTP